MCHTACRSCSRNPKYLASLTALREKPFEAGTFSQGSIRSQGLRMKATRFMQNPRWLPSYKDSKAKVPFPASGRKSQISESLTIPDRTSSGKLFSQGGATLPAGAKLLAHVPLPITSISGSSPAICLIPRRTRGWSSTEMGRDGLISHRGWLSCLFWFPEYKVLTN
jgi:hypothetical protein